MRQFMQHYAVSECKGQRLKQSALAVTVGDKNIAEVTALSIEKLQKFLERSGTDADSSIMIGGSDLKGDQGAYPVPDGCGTGLSDAWPVQPEPCPAERHSVSGWQHRSVPVWSALPIFWMSRVSVCISGTMTNCWMTLKHLRDLGNSLIVVEHDEDTMLCSGLYRGYRSG